MTEKMLINNVRPNRTKARLAAGQTCFGLSMSFASDQVVEMAAAAGCDFIMFDMEHEPSSLPEVLSMTRTADLSGMTPIARLGRGHQHLIDPLLSAGVQGFVLARITSAVDITAFTDMLYYYPLGRRTAWYSGRNANFGIGTEGASWSNQINKELLLNVVIEDKQAVENLDEILAHPLLDVIEVGAGDLRLSLGLPSVEEVTGVEAWIFAQAVAAGKFVLEFAAGHNLAPRVWQEVRPGHGTMIVATASGIMTTALLAMSSEVRQRSRPRL